jgi:hypothetical protein
LDDIEDGVEQHWLKIRDVLVEQWQRSWGIRIVTESIGCQRECGRK